MTPQQAIDALEQATKWFEGDEKRRSIRTAIEVIRAAMPKEPEPKTLGEIAWDAFQYRASPDRPIPWVHSIARDSWEAAALAVKAHMEATPPPPLKLRPMADAPEGVEVLARTGDDYFELAKRHGDVMFDGGGVRIHLPFYVGWLPVPVIEL